MKKIGILLIAIGIVIIMIPVAGSMYNSYRQKKLLAEFREQLNGQMQDNTVDEEIADIYEGLDDIFKEDPLTSESTQTQVSSAAESSTQSTTAVGTSAQTTEPAQTATTKETEKYKPKVIGTLQIKRLKIDVLVVEGIGNEDLKVGAGHFPGTAEIGEYGNCAVAGHRSYTFGKFFNRLNEVTEGDKIVVSNGIESFTYVVYKIHIVEPKDTYVLNQVEDHRILTLVTCEPIYVATHRLIVHAKILD